MKTLRLLWVGWRFYVKNLTLSGFFILTSVIQPVIFASVAYLMFRAGARPGTLLYVALGAGMMGIWSSTLFGSGGAIQWQRWQGTLEVLVSAPTPFVLVIAPLTLATSVIGIYSLASTLVWGRLVFGIPFHVVHWLAFVVAVPSTILGLGLLGLVFASTFVLYRHANALSNMLEWPVLLVTGMLVPLSLLPGWAHPIGWALSPTWGVRGLREAALGGTPWPDIALCLGVGLAYAAVGVLCAEAVLRSARQNASLSLT